MISDVLADNRDAIHATADQIVEYLNSPATAACYVGVVRSDAHKIVTKLRSVAADMDALRVVLDTPPAPRCDMTKECAEPITHIDVKGYLYCRKHGIERKAAQRCRQLTRDELKHLAAGDAEIVYG